MRWTPNGFPGWTVERLRSGRYVVIAPSGERIKFERTYTYRFVLVWLSEHHRDEEFQHRGSRA